MSLIFYIFREAPIKIIKMKNILLFLIGAFTCFETFAQNPDPELFKTWYLSEIVSDFNSWLVADVSPRIDPTLTFTETLTFYGEAACNSYSGTLSYDSSSNWFEVISFERSFNTCNIQAHTDFEINFFEFFWVGKAFNPGVSNETNGMQTLYTLSPWYPVFVLKNNPLSVSENNKLKATIYPNPVSEELFIASEGITIEKIKIYSISGSQIIEASLNLNSIDVSNLSEGLYFLQIFSSEGNRVQKFIKH